MKRAAALVASALLLAGCAERTPPSAPAANASQPRSWDRPFPALTGRVVDGAELLSPAEEERLTAALAALEARTTDQLVVVTVPTLDGRPIEDFGLALGNHWRLGRDGKDNGVLLIVAPAERMVRIEVGYGLEAILTNERAHEIIQSDILPRFRESRWHPGIEAGTQAMIATLVAHEREPRRGR